MREAIQGLLSLGVIERRGNRTCVAEHLPDVSVDLGDQRKGFVEELFETRRVLEVPIFALAAERSDADGRAAVAAILDRFVDDLDIDTFRRLDREFHTTIASRCGNPLLIELYGKVLDQLFRSSEFESLLSDERHRSTVRRIVADAIDGHRSIVAALVANDAVAMELASTTHLASVEQSMIDDLG